MDKKLLVSLMMTAPVATAFASAWSVGTGDDNGYLKYVISPNATTGQNNWTVNGDQAAGLLDVNEGNGTISIKLGVGTLSHTSMGMLRGTYTFNYSNLTNAILKVNNRYLAEKTEDGKAYKTNETDKKGNPVTIAIADATDADAPRMISLGTSGSFDYNSNPDSTTGGEGSSLSLIVLPQVSDAAYGIGEVSGKFNFNFQNCYTDLNNQLIVIKNLLDTTIDDLTEAERKDEVKALTDKKAEYMKTYNSLLATVRMICPNPEAAWVGKNETALSRMMSVYNAQDLYLYGDNDSKTVDPLSKDIAALKTNADSYKKLVDAENTNWANIQDNKVLLNGDNGYIARAAALKTTVDKLEPGKLPTGKSGELLEYLTYVSKNVVTNAQNALKDLNDLIDKIKNNMTVATTAADKAKIEAQFIAVQNQINSVSYTTAENNFNVFTYFIGYDSTKPSALDGIANPQTVKTVQVAYMNAQNDIDKCKKSYKKYDGTTVANVYADKVNDYSAQLDKAYDGNDGYAISQEGAFTNEAKTVLNTSNPEIAEATVANYTASNTTMNERINAMKALPVELKAFVDAQNDHYLGNATSGIQGAKQVIDGYNTSNGLDGIFAMLTNPAFDKIANNAALKTAIQNLQTAYSNLKTTAENLFLANTLWDVDKNDYNSAYTTALSNYNTAWNTYSTEKNKTGYAGPIAAINAYEDAKVKVKAATDADQTYGSDILGLFTPGLDFISQQVDDYVKNKPTDSTVSTTIVDACSKLVSTCETLCESFANVEEKVASAQDVADLLIEDTAAGSDKLVTNPIDNKTGYTVPATFTWKDKNNDKVTLSATTVKNNVQQDNTTLGQIAKAETVTIDGVEYNCSNPETAIEAANKLSETMDTDAYTEQVQNARATLALNIAKGNQKVLDAMEKYLTKYTEATTTKLPDDAVGLSAVKKILDQVNNPTDEDGKPIGGGVEIAGTAASVSADITAAEDTYTTDKDSDIDTALDDLQWTLDGVDDTCKEVVDAYTNAYTELVKVVNNYEAYTEVKGLITAAQTKAAGINVSNLTATAAVNHYNGVLNTIKNDINRQLGTTKASNLWNEYQAMTAYTNKATLIETYPDSFNTRLQNLVNDIQANNTAFETIQNEYNRVSVIADDLYNTINTDDKVGSYKQDYLNQITEVSTTLQSLLAASRTKFANGQATSDTTTVGEIKKLEEKLAEIKAGELKDYYDAVMAANKTYLSNYNGDTLSSDYQKAVDVISQYYFVKNASYFDAMQASVDFQTYYADLQACQSNVASYKVAFTTFLTHLVPGFVSPETTTNDVRKNWIVLTDATVATLSSKLSDELTKLQREYTSINNSIITDKNGATDEAYKVAVKFYDVNVNGNEGGLAIYNSIKAGLQTAGLTTGEANAALANQTDLSALTVAKNNINNLYNGKRKANKPNEWEIYPLKEYMTDGVTPDANEFILGMTNIADQNDTLVNTDVDNDVDLGVDYQWNQLYASVETALNNGLKAIDTPSTEQEDSDYNDISDALAKAKELDEQWSKLDSKEYSDKYSTYKANLNYQTNSAKTLADQYYNGQEKAKAIEKLYTGSNSPMVNALNAVENGVLAYSGYHPAQILLYNGYVGQLDAVRNKTAYADVTNGTVQYNVTKELNDLAKSLNSLQNYYNMYRAEYEYAYNLYNTARAAFNNAKSASVAEDVLEGYDSRLNNINASLTPLNIVVAPWDDDNEDFTEANKQSKINQLFAQEELLSILIAEIEEKASVEADQRQLNIANAKYNAALTAAEESVTALQANYNSASEYGDYGTEVENEFKSAVEGASNEVTSVKSAVEALDNADYMIMDVDKFAYLLGQVSGDVDGADGLASKLDAAVTQAAQYHNSDVIYDECKEKVDNLWTDVKFANDLAGQYDVATNTNGLYTNVDTDINGVEATDDNPAVPGILSKLMKKKQLHGFTGDAEEESVVEGYINGTSYTTYAQLEAAVNKYVRNTLTNVACTEADNDLTKIVGIYNAVNTPTPNENGWSMKVYNADEKLAQLTDELEKFRNSEGEFYYRNIAIAISSVAKPAQAPANDTYNPADSYINNTANNVEFANAAQAKASYQIVMDALAAVMQSVGDIENSLESDRILRGDVVADGIINAGDIQKLIELVGQGVELDGSKESAIQDVNGNGLLNIADVSSLINVWLNGPSTQNYAAARLASFLPAANGNNSYMVAEVQGENGLRRFAVNLANEVNFVAGQLDIILPSHARVAGVHVGDRANTLDTYVFENDGYTRVLMTALDNSPIEGNNGCVLFIDVDGNAEVEVENVIFSDANGKDYFVSNSSESGVGIMDAVKDGVKAIYNAAGQKLNKLTKGVNIVRNADGSVTKKIGK